MAFPLQGTIAHAKTTAVATNLVVKASPGKLYGLWGYNNSASAQYIQVHNATTLPADGASVPIVTFKVAAGDNFSLDVFAFNRYIPCDTGITICNSSTLATKTIGSADVWINALYR